MNQSELIRAYVAEHPGCTGKEITTGAGGPHDALIKLAGKMVLRGLLVATVHTCQCCGVETKRYSLGRASKVVKAKSEEERKARRKASFKKIDAKRLSGGSRRKARAAADPKAALRLLVRDCAKSEPKVAQTIAAQSVDEWLASGGRMEVLAGPRHVLPSSMPYGARYGVAG